MKEYFAAVLFTATLWAQSPEKISYQAVIRNSSGVLETNTQIGMEINIRQGSVSGTVVYTETQTPTTNANGLVSIETGGGAGFNTIDWSAGPYFIETKTDPARWHKLHHYRHKPVVKRTLCFARKNGRNC